MSGYLVRRVLLIVPTLIGVTVLISLVVRVLPGDLVTLMLAEQGFGNRDRAALAHQLGVDRPWPVQYGQWASKAARGDLGVSLRTHRSIGAEIRRRLPITLELGGLALLLSLAVSLPTGVIAAVRQNHAIDYLMRSAAIGALAIPGFWLATLLVVWPAIWFHWSPSISYVGFFDDPIANIEQVILPAALLSLALTGATMRITRSMMLEVMRQDFVRTAQAKGLPAVAVIVRHAIRNAAIPVVTVIGLQIPVLVGGSVVFESIFSLPGIGQYLLNALQNRDYTVIQGIDLVFAILVIGANIVVDSLYPLLDARVRLS